MGVWDSVRSRWRRRRTRRGTEDGHVTGRTHLVFDDGSIVEAELDPEARTRAEYLARRAVAPPPPKD
jgi:hypothetical protein